MFNLNVYNKNADDQKGVFGYQQRFEKYIQITCYLSNETQPSVNKRDAFATLIGNIACLNNYMSVYE